MGKNHSSNDKVTVCMMSKNKYHWSKTSIICFYHQSPRLSADTWARPLIMCISLIEKGRRCMAKCHYILERKKKGNNKGASSGCQKQK